MGAGTGIRCGGEDGVAALDADTLDEKFATLIRERIHARFGILPTRIGRSPKAAYFCRVSGPMSYKGLKFDGGKLEILADGQQVVVSGIHPVTMAPYRWTVGLPKLSELPVFSSADIQALVDELRPLLPGASVYAATGSGKEVDQKTLRGELEIVRKAVLATGNTDTRFPSREHWRDYGYGIKAALPDDESAAREIFREWSARWDHPEKSTPDDYLDKEWARMKPPFRRGASWLYEIAEKSSGGVFSKAEAWFEPIVEEPESIFGGNENEEAPVRFLFDAEPLAEFDPTKLPVRESVYGGHYVKKFLSMTVAPSKVGKSSLALVECVAMASGRALLGIKPSAPQRVLYYNGEDPMDEILRRVGAIMTHYGVSWPEIGDRLFLVSGRDTPLVLARHGRAGVEIDKAAVAAFEDTIRRRRIEVFVLDPFVSVHRVPENDNNSIETVAKELARVCDRCNCAGELVHHVRKLGGAEATVEDGRGASALLAATRSARALARMTAMEASRFGLKDVARRLFRFTETSSNMFLPPAGESVAWMELASVSLGNGSGEEALDRLLNGDSVGVVRLFDMPSEAERILKAVEGGGEAIVKEDRLRQLVSERAWRLDSRSGEDWVGRPLARAYEIDLEDTDGTNQIRALLKTLLKSGRLEEYQAPDSRRRVRSFVRISDHNFVNKEVSE